MNEEVDVAWNWLCCLGLFGPLQFLYLDVLQTGLNVWKKVALLFLIFRFLSPATHIFFIFTYDMH